VPTLSRHHHDMSTKAGKAWHRDHYDTLLWGRAWMWDD
jgi:hypothetical protein